MTIEKLLQVAKDTPVTDEQIKKLRDMLEKQGIENDAVTEEILQRIYSI